MARAYDTSLIILGALFQKVYGVNCYQNCCPRNHVNLVDLQILL